MRINNLLYARVANKLTNCKEPKFLFGLLILQQTQGVMCALGSLSQQDNSQEGCGRSIMQSSKVISRKDPESKRYLSAGLLNRILPKPNQIPLLVEQHNSGRFEKQRLAGAWTVSSLLDLYCIVKTKILTFSGVQLNGCAIISIINIWLITFDYAISVTTLRYYCLIVSVTFGSKNAYLCAIFICIIFQLTRKNLMVRNLKRAKKKIEKETGCRNTNTQAIF